MPNDTRKRPPSKRPPSKRSPSERQCPICGKPVELRWQPFCSKRCADVDLGRWFGERYAIPGEPAESPSSGSRSGEED